MGSEMCIRDSYHFHSKKLFESAQITYEFPNAIFTKDISGVSFDIMPAQVTLNSLTVYQDYYATRIDDYVLSFIISYSSDSEKDELKEVLSRLIISV